LGLLGSAIRPLTQPTRRITGLHKKVKEGANT
jgi:hypothetical protein